jgi:hypothetical protein
MGEMTNAYKIFVEKPNGERIIGGFGADGRMILKGMLNKRSGNNVDKIYVGYYRRAQLWLVIYRVRDSWGP